MCPEAWKSKTRKQHRARSMRSDIKKASLDQRGPVRAIDMEIKTASARSPIWFFVRLIRPLAVADIPLLIEAMICK